MFNTSECSFHLRQSKLQVLFKFSAPDFGLLQLRGSIADPSPFRFRAALCIGTEVLFPNCKRPQYLVEGQHLPLPRTGPASGEHPFLPGCGQVLIIRFTPYIKEYHNIVQKAIGFRGFLLPYL